MGINPSTTTTDATNKTRMTNRSSAVSDWLDRGRSKRLDYQLASDDEIHARELARDEEARAAYWRTRRFQEHEAPIASSNEQVENQL